MAAAVILTGFMGSGKSVVGRLLAKQLGWEFVDTDAVVENRTGRKIAELFDSEGEDAFRKMEEEAVIKSIDERRAGLGRVVSLGGGAVASSKVAGLLKKEPLVFFLDIDMETAFKRAGTKARPLARNKDVFHRLFAEREHLYRRLAACVVDTRGKDVDIVAGEIIDEVHRRQQAGTA